MTNEPKEPAGPAAGGSAKTGVAKPGSGKPGTAEPAQEIGGRGGPDPTRFGDWEINGRCVDF